MKSRTLMCITAITLFGALAISVRLDAQERSANQQHKSEHNRYKLVDVGTFGGPSGYVAQDLLSTGSSSGVLNNRGALVGAADTSTPDPDYLPGSGFFPIDPLIMHAFQWQKGVLTDLGALPGNNNSFATWISANGLIAGFSENGVIDPQFGVPQVDAVLWKDGKIIDLGGYFSSAGAVNNRGQVVGNTLNTATLPALNVRAFLWENGKMQDLGTLGGTFAGAGLVNERGQVSGVSYTNSTPNPVTGIPTQDPYLWENGTMLDLGTLGGTFGVPNALNNRGQVVGQSNLAGDANFHPFLWEGSALRDLGTLGGDFGTAYSISESGDVVGWSTTPGDSAVHAFLWSGGTITDLGVLEGEVCSVAYAVNTKRQVVGYSDDDCNHGNAHAFLWENGVMIDLNSFVPPDSGVQLTFALSISERGEIATLGLLPNGDQHVFAVMPTGQKAGLSASTTKVGHPGNAVSRPTPSDLITRIRVQMGKRYRTPARGGAWK